MKLKLTVLGLCFLTTNVQWVSAQPAGAAATTGSAVAAMGVGTAAEQTPPVVQVDSGASPKSSFAYIAVTPTQKGKTIWLEPVSDKDYNSVK